MIETMITDLTAVRAIIDGMLAAWASRQLARRTTRMMSSCAPVECCREDAEPILTSSADMRPRGRHVRPCLPAASARLPEELHVPPVESRPPNLHAANLSFAARLVIAVRDKFAGNAPKVYAAANVSRQVYSQIVSDETRPVSKRTAIRFAFALRSSPDEARILLKSAGYAFSNSQTEDFILQACLEVNPPIWDLSVVNQLLKEYRVDFQY